MNTNKLIFLEKSLGKNKIKVNESLSLHTTFKIGGPAEFFFVAETTDDLLNAIQAAKALEIKCFVLGSGSNVLVSDDKLSGLIIKNQAKSIQVVKRIGKVVNGQTQVEKVLLSVDSGALVNRLVRFACDEGLEGLERHLGLPGTVGGAIYNNSKWTKPLSYFGDTVFQAQILTGKGDILTVNRDYFKFDYDYSILQKTHEIVLTVTFMLKKAKSEELWKIANNSIDYRKKTQPMGVQTAGCIFKNISLSKSIEIGTPNHTTSAGYLLDQAGLKNFQIGQAKFSDNHANFIINLGGASHDDILNLIRTAKQKVKQKFGVELELEVIHLKEMY